MASHPAFKKFAYLKVEDILAEVQKKHSISHFRKI